MTSLAIVLPVLMLANFCTVTTGIKCYVCRHMDNFNEDKNCVSGKGIKEQTWDQSKCDSLNENGVFPEDKTKVEEIQKEALEMKNQGKGQSEIEQFLLKSMPFPYLYGEKNGKPKCVTIRTTITSTSETGTKTAELLERQPFCTKEKDGCKNTSNGDKDKGTNATACFCSSDNCNTGSRFSMSSGLIIFSMSLILLKLGTY